MRSLSSLITVIYGTLNKAKATWELHFEASLLVFMSWTQGFWNWFIFFYFSQVFKKLWHQNLSLFHVGRHRKVTLYMSLEFIDLPTYILHLVSIRHCYPLKGKENIIPTLKEPPTQSEDIQIKYNIVSAVLELWTKYYSSKCRDISNSEKE